MCVAVVRDVGSMTVMDFKGFSLRKASSLFFITLTTTYGHVRPIHITTDRSDQPLHSSETDDDLDSGE